MFEHLEWESMTIDCPACEYPYMDTKWWEEHLIVQKCPRCSWEWEDDSRCSHHCVKLIDGNCPICAQEKVMWDEQVTMQGSPDVDSLEVI